MKSAVTPIRGHSIAVLLITFLFLAAACGDDSESTPAGTPRRRRRPRRLRPILRSLLPRLRQLTTPQPTPTPEPTPTPTPTPEPTPAATADPATAAAAEAEQLLAAVAQNLSTMSTAKFSMVDETESGRSVLWSDVEADGGRG